MNKRNKNKELIIMLYQNNDFCEYDISDAPLAMYGEQFLLFYDEMILLNDSIDSIIDKVINRKNETGL